MTPTRAVRDRISTAVRDCATFQTSRHVQIRTGVQSVDRTFSHSRRELLLSLLFSHRVAVSKRISIIARS